MWIRLNFVGLARLCGLGKIVWIKQDYEDSARFRFGEVFWIRLDYVGSARFCGLGESLWIRLEFED